jgi:hypothetical protein
VSAGVCILSQAPAGEYSAGDAKFRAILLAVAAMPRLPPMQIE